VAPACRHDGRATPVRAADDRRAARAPRRWLTRAIAPGIPLWPTVQLFMRGQIRLGQWRPFTACQVLAPPAGCIWAATARLAGLPVTRV
jgi:Family of unknown function (DUF6544)